MSLEPAVALVAAGCGLFTVMPLERRIGIMKDLMRGMDLVTLVGQGHAMNKILVLLRREALRLTPPVAAEDLASLSTAMTELEHEVGRIAPSPSIFNDHVEAAIGALRRTSPSLDRWQGTP